MSHLQHTSRLFGAPRSEKLPAVPLLQCQLLHQCPDLAAWRLCAFGWRLPEEVAPAADLPLTARIAFERIPVDYCFAEL